MIIIEEVTDLAEAGNGPIKDDAKLSLIFGIMSLLLNPLFIMFPLSKIVGTHLLGIFISTPFALLAILLSYHYWRKDKESYRSIIGFTFALTTLMFIVILFSILLYSGFQVF